MREGRSTQAGTGRWVPAGAGGGRGGPGEAGGAPPELNLRVRTTSIVIIPTHPMSHARTPRRHPDASSNQPAALRLRIKKGSDGKVAAFALHRRDGSVTVMRNPHAFFPVHDLTHYAVETTLRHRRGFYGLVCDGWNFEDFGTPWPRGPLPEDNDPAEVIVGFLDLERATGHLITAEELNAKVADYLARPSSQPVTTVVTAEALERIRARLKLLQARWYAVAPGEALELDYDPGEDMPGHETEEA